MNKNDYINILEEIIEIILNNKSKDFSYLDECATATESFTIYLEQECDDGVLTEDECKELIAELDDFYEIEENPYRTEYVGNEIDYLNFSIQAYDNVNKYIDIAKVSEVNDKVYEQLTEYLEDGIYSRNEIQSLVDTYLVLDESKIKGFTPVWDYLNKVSDDIENVSDKNTLLNFIGDLKSRLDTLNMDSLNFEIDDLEEEIDEYLSNKMITESEAKVLRQTLHSLKEDI